MWRYVPYEVVEVAGLVPFDLSDARRGCGDERDGWHCTRLPHAAGRHLATAGGLRVMAAWPGDHEPTAADLEAVPS